MKPIEEYSFKYQDGDSKYPRVQIAVSDMYIFFLYICIVLINILN